MAAATLVLTLALLLAGVYLLVARHPRFLILSISYGGAWFYHGLTLLKPKEPAAANYAAGFHP